MGKGRISRQSGTPLPQGGGADTQPNFWASLLLVHTPFDAELSILPFPVDLLCLPLQQCTHCCV